ncbi:MAG: hypothetical protein IT372_29865 [Polyangiaceae bacterium]|nr:hypothetical protein [Polyangiaceae bacterium]
MRARDLICAPALIALVISGFVPACAAPVDDTDAIDDPEAVKEAEQPIIIDDDCPPYADPCDCAFEGTPMCADPDGDGIPTMDDNCPYVSNPNQANCDNDGAGDVCDSLDGTQTKTQYSVYEGVSHYQYDGWCYLNYATYYRAYGKYHDFEQVTTTYCAGPQAGQTVTTTNDLGYTYSFLCYQYAHSCPTPNMGYVPTPWCG